MGPGYSVADASLGSFGPPPPHDKDELLKAIEAAALSDSAILPLPSLPQPPRPSSRSSRVMSRYRKALRLWVRGSEMVSILNSAWMGRPSDHGSDKRSSADTRPQRIRNADVEPHVRRGWSLVLEAAKRLQTSRRQSKEIDATGAELWARLRKSVTDAYGRPVDGKPTYKPFVAKLVKELPLGAPTVDFLEEAPPALSHVFSDEANVVKDMSPEERREFDDLCRRYDHVGGERRKHGRHSAPRERASPRGQSPQ